ncbi:MAG TPA: ATP-grasp domain-containing protein [Methylophilaceae bacterium]|nr:ATP-grasp domain-containing protein [Methylophilaceae bacterium]
MYDIAVEQIDHRDDIHFWLAFLDLKLKIFVCEYITGGGLYREELPASLVREGSLMRDAVLHDLSILPGISTLCTWDARLPEPSHAHQAVRVGDDVWSLWKQCIAEADAVLPIAPETGNILLTLTDAIEISGKTLIGCGVEGVEIASSKLATCRALQAADIDVVPTWEAASFPAGLFKQYVVKPDDGAGCGGTMIFSCQDDFMEWLAENKTGYVAQPYLEGVSASLCMLCRNGQAWLLSCNRQKVTEESGAFVYKGSVLNGVSNWDAFERLARDISRAIPSLAGYIGVDVIIHETGISVLEINPRLTTSYAGLHEAMGCNPAELLLDLLYNSRSSPGKFQMPAIQRHIVDVSLDV